MRPRPNSACGLENVTLLVGGLLYGWLVQPVEFVDTTPDSLRQDYKTDFVLMVAEAYQAERDLSQAERRLAMLGPAAPLTKVERALEFARENRFAGPDALIRLN